MRFPSFLKTIYKNRQYSDNLPRYLTYIITYRCNARCIMCDSWKIHDAVELSIDEIEKSFKQLPKMDAVRLSGGEPFVRKDLPQIATLAEEYLDPGFLHITSNGFLTDRITSFLENRDKKTPLYLLISIDGMKDLHNHIRGIKTAWKKANETLGQIAPMQKKWNVRLSVNQTVVDDEGLDHYYLLQQHLKQYGISNNLVFAYDVSATYNLNRSLEVQPKNAGEYSSFGEFSRERLMEFFRHTENNLKHSKWHDSIAKRYYFHGMANRLLFSKGKPNPKCVAVNTHLRINPDGSIPICQFNNKTIGSLKEQSFSEIWKGEKRMKARKWVQNCPGCWAECESLPNGIYTMDILPYVLPKKILS